MAAPVLTNEYLALYEEMTAHQREHNRFFRGQRDQPSEYCTACLTERRPGVVVDSFDIKKRYSWAVPDEPALAVIARYSPNGVVEIGAGGGYWAMLLRERGVDVVAYDPDPEATGEHTWHSGRRWSEVLRGDHTAVIGHPDRTLFLCWPNYDMSWTDQVIDLFEGDTVVYVGEGSGGCTGTDRMHALLGEQTYCPHWDDEPCTCDPVQAKFQHVETVEIPQWWGMHDRLNVYKRRS
jgi:hypothetical protein